MYQIKCYASVMSIKTDWFSSESVLFISQKVSKNWVIAYLPLKTVPQRILTLWKQYKEKSPECFIELTLIAKYIVNLSIIVVSSFKVKKNTILHSD